MEDSEKSDIIKIMDFQDILEPAELMVLTEFVELMELMERTEVLTFSLNNSSSRSRDCQSKKKCIE